MRVDLTSDESSGWDLIERFGSQTVPWLVVLDRSGRLVFREAWYTDSSVLAALESARESASR